ncbi:unnamed protein product [Miscanthus lutarioriparius]|uniref:Uncharacterized protein n=1 Tax=Miscanthus lutarioriparius TaxID=422564 RepID=A0A811QB23_9POAL|nr:unnamed protein product [Miscanthus lutarioriparius]
MAAVAESPVAMAAAGDEPPVEVATAAAESPVAAAAVALLDTSRPSLEIGRHGDRWPWRAEAIEEARRFKFLPPALYLLLLFIPPPSGIQRQPCRGARMGLQQELTTFAAPAPDAASPAVFKQPYRDDFLRFYIHHFKLGIWSRLRC